jgi:hypothetical protein
VHHPLGDPLTVEMADLLQELVIFQSGGSACPDRALVLIVVDRVALPVRQNAPLTA